MQYKKLWAVATLATALGFTAWAADGPLSITADEMSYDGNTKIATASGNVVIVNGADTLQGASGWYNVASQTAHLEGGVTISGPDLQGQAATMEASQNGNIHATGDVSIQKGTDHLTGSDVTYNTQTGEGVVIGGSVSTSDASMSADHIQAWLHEIRVVGVGQVRLHSSENNLNATGDKITYVQTPGQNDGVAYLEGNAYAEQNGNVLQGPSLTVRMEDRSVSTTQRSTLVIHP